MSRTKRTENPDRRRERGIYLISTLLLLTFLVMLGGAIAVSFQQGLASSGNFNNRQMALNAAMSGLQYIQARLESNPSIYGPGYTAPSTLDIVQANELKVREKQDTSTRAVNICGYIDNTITEAGSESQIYLMFRATFNGSYTSFAAQPTDWLFVNFNNLSWGTALGAMQEVSMNNLLRSSQLGSGTSYTASGRAFHRVPGGTADIIVEGLVVRSDGLVVARRLVEGCYGLSGAQSSTAPGAATAARDMNISLYQNASSGGNLTVGVGPGVNSAFSDSVGIASYSGNINLNGLDAATSQTAPPDYTSPDRASVLASKAFNYSWGGGSQSYSPGTSGQTVVQAQQVSPPNVKVSDLPTQANPLALSAGTWVVWNGQILHYPVDYDSTVPLTAQNWSGGGTTTAAPALNGQTPDSATLPTGVSFSGASNTLTVSSDVLVSAASGANGLALVVAPASNQPASGGTNSASVGSAQLVFDASSGTTPQLRSPGSVAVVGNVTGQGALVSTGTAGNNGAGDITVIGKSSLDPRSDAGVALYAAGNVNLKQLSYGQAPAAVPAVRDTMTAVGVSEGTDSGAGSTSANIGEPAAAIYAAIAQAMNGRYADLQHEGYLSFDGGSLNYTLTVGASRYGDFGNKIKEQSVSVTYKGVPRSGKLKDVLGTIAADVTAGGTGSNGTVLQQLLSGTNTGSVIGAIAARGVTSGSTTLVASFLTQTGWSTSQYVDGNTTVTTGHISQAAFGNIMASGSSTTSLTAAAPAGAGSTTSGGGTTGAAAGGGTQITQTALNQSFSGLVYAGHDCNIRNGLGSVTVNGMVAAYGGDPNTQSVPGQDTSGNINLSGNSVTLLYDPSTLGPYLYLFGGVQLHVNSLSNF